MNKANDSTAFQIEWDLHELGPKEKSIYRDVSAQMDFSRFDLAQALAAGYVPANARRFNEDKAA